MSEQPEWLVRKIEEFSEPAGEFVAAYPVHGVSLKTLQKVWGRPSTDAMVDVFSVDASQHKLVEKWLGKKLPLRGRSYFLAASTSDWAATKRDGGFMGKFPPPEDFGARPMNRARGRTAPPKSSRR